MPAKLTNVTQMNPHLKRLECCFNAYYDGPLLRLTTIPCMLIKGGIYSHFFSPLLHIVFELFLIFRRESVLNLTCIIFMYSIFNLMNWKSYIPTNRKVYFSFHIKYMVNYLKFESRAPKQELATVLQFSLGIQPEIW